MCGGEGSSERLDTRWVRVCFLRSLQIGVAGVVKAVHLYIWLVSKSWNSAKMVMESHGKVNHGISFPDLCGNPE